MHHFRTITDEIIHKLTQRPKETLGSTKFQITAMTSFRTDFDEPAIMAPDAADFKKYRLSCDRCQNSKVRCSQDKPTCKRCLQRGVVCVYSPLRRIGRPRKVSGDDAIANERSSDSMTPSPCGEYSYHIPVILRPHLSYHKYPTAAITPQFHAPPDCSSID